MMDFVSDQLDTGRLFRVLAIYDVCSCQCLVAIAGFSFTGKRMAEEP